MPELGLVRPDLAGLDALITESERDGHNFLRRIPGLVAENPRYLDSRGSFVLGVYDDGALVGIGGVTPDPYLSEPDLGRVRHVYIARAHRRHGVGRMLIGGLEFRATVAYKRLRLRAITAEAAAFYETLGYQRIVDDKATHMKVLSAPQPPHVRAAAMVTALGAETKKRVDALFMEPSRSEVVAMLERQCGRDLPLCANANDLEIERIRFAVLKLSDGDMVALRRALEVARQDWRDVLVAAGFGHDIHVHREWWPESPGA